MEKVGQQIGIVGLGVMGHNLALNMVDHGFSVAGYDQDAGRVQSLQLAVKGESDPAKFIGLLQVPRTILMMVPSGPPVDAVILELVPLLEPGDLLIDGGNSYFKDTNARARLLTEKDILFLGLGVSGGAHGARHGPSLMPGGPKSAYDRVSQIFEFIAAKVNGEPCVTYLGPGSAGHYVKMVHNGIEYALMQLISETYDLMKRGLGLNDDELSDVYTRWNQEELNSYLVEIAGTIFRHLDEKTGNRLIDVILDESKQKGTGKWTSQDAMDLQIPVTVIDTAVGIRHLSNLKSEREAASKVLNGPVTTFQGDRVKFLNQLRNALYAAMIIAYAQGMAQLRAASHAYQYSLDLSEVARIWRGGCIIRAAVLEEIRTAFNVQPNLVNLLVDPYLGQAVVSRQDDLRAVVRTTAELGLPMPGLMSALAYFDSYRSSWLPANLIQAQRDYFGAHTYERTDVKGTFHTQWEED